MSRSRDALCGRRQAGGPAHPVPGGGMQPLEVPNPTELHGTTVLTRSVNSVDLAIPADYRLLRVWWSARTDDAVAPQAITMTFNGDTAAHYGDQRAEAHVAALSGVQTATASGIFVGTALGGASTA